MLMKLAALYRFGCMALCPILIIGLVTGELIWKRK